MKRQFCVVGLYRNIPKAQVALQVLGSAHFQDEEVSFVTHSDAPELKELDAITHVQDGRVDEGLSDEMENEKPASRTVTGALAGGTLAVPLALGTALFPVFIAGPLLAGGLGAIVGALADGGKATDVGSLDPLHLQEKIEQGAALIVVTGEEYRIDEAKGLMITCDPMWVEKREIPT